MDAYKSAAKRRETLMSKRLYVLRTKMEARRLPTFDPIRRQLEARYLQYVAAFKSADASCSIYRR